MTTVIQLDTNAVMALFPEGTEARVQLMQAVIQNICNRTSKTIVPEEVARHIERQRQITKEIVDASFREHFQAVGNGWNERMAPTAKMLDIMKEAAADFLVKQTSKVIEEARADREESIKKNLTSVTSTIPAKMTQIMEAEITRLIKEDPEIKARVKEELLKKLASS